MAMRNPSRLQCDEDNPLKQPIDAGGAALYTAAQADNYLEPPAYKAGALRGAE